jgi:hypothetical protein
MTPAKTKTKRLRHAISPARAVASIMLLGLMVLTVWSENEAAAQNTVTPTCPTGFVFSGQACVPAAPTPTCPDGFIFSSSGCVVATVDNSGPWVLLLARALQVTKSNELDGATICVDSGQPSEAATTAYFKAQNVSITPVAASSENDAIDRYAEGACDGVVVAENAAETIVRGLSQPSAHMILPEKIVAAGLPTAPPPPVAAPAPAPAQPPIRRAAPQPAPADLATPLQRELKRIGCLTGRVDGIWGRGSRAALKRFSDQAGLRLGSEPSQLALKEARNTEAGYCQPVRVAPRPQPQQGGCRAGTVLLEGQCIPKSQVRSFCGPGYERKGTKCVSMAGQVPQLDRCVAADIAFCRPLANEYCEGDGSRSCIEAELDMCLRDEIGCTR